MERPLNLAEILYPSQTLTLIDKAKRYDGDVRALKEYIEELETLARYYEEHPKKDVSEYIDALHEISSIVGKTIGYPVAVG
jgi:hypothetical protein